MAELRQKVAGEREAALNHLKTSNDEANAKTSALLAESTKHHSESAEPARGRYRRGGAIRAAAVAEAEGVKQGAQREAADWLAAAKKQAAAIGERTQQEFAWRKQQLRRETELLHQRKQALLSQLANLSALAEQTAHAFPDLDDPEDPSERRPGDDAEPPVDAESGPAEDVDAETGYPEFRLRARPRGIRGAQRPGRDGRDGDKDNNGDTEGRRQRCEW